MSNQESSDFPLNPLSFKGVFSTHMRIKGHSEFNHMYNTVHHVKYLGLGTYQAQLPDILNAVLVKMGSDADGHRAETYSLKRMKSGEAMWGKSLARSVNHTKEATSGQQLELIGIKEIEAITDEAGWVGAGKHREASLHYTEPFRKQHTKLAIMTIQNWANLMKSSLIRPDHETYSRVILAGTGTITDSTDMWAAKMISAVQVVIYNAVKQLSGQAFADNWAKKLMKYASVLNNFAFHSNHSPSLVTVPNLFERVIVHPSGISDISSTAVKTLTGNLLHVVLSNRSMLADLEALMASGFKLMNGLLDFRTYSSRKESLGGVDVLVLFEKNLQSTIMETNSAAMRPVNFARIDFEHEIVGSDSTIYKAFLDSISPSMLRDNQNKAAIMNEDVQGASKRHSGELQLAEQSRKVITGSEAPFELARKVMVGEQTMDDFLTEKILNGTLGHELEEAFRRTEEGDGTFIDVAAILLRTNPSLSIDREAWTVGGVIRDAFVGQEMKGQVHTIHKPEIVQDLYAHKPIEHAALVTALAFATEFPEPEYEYHLLEGSGLDSLWGVHVTETGDFAYEPELTIKADLGQELPVYLYDSDQVIEASLGETDEGESVFRFSEAPMLGELSTELQLFKNIEDLPVTGELAHMEQELVYIRESDPWAVKVVDSPSKVDGELQIAVFAYAQSPVSFRRRPNLVPDDPEYPKFEHICDHYVCEDWLQVPLRDFNYDTGLEFYDPLTFRPHYPTGEADADGNPYILAPYSILNEPLSQGADVGGKELMAINPCNLYDVIQYIIKVYDYMRAKFIASSPIDVMSRMMNMLYDEILKLVNDWEETKAYSPDELWRIYRFVRWFAIGVTNRFYRLKLVYDYTAYTESFDGSYSDRLVVDGGAIRFVNGYGSVLDAHPQSKSDVNVVETVFEVPAGKSSILSFDLGNVVPDRPDKLEFAGIVMKEDFSGSPVGYKVKGTGWVPVKHLSGYALAVENPAQARTYGTDVISIPNDLRGVSIGFDYSLDTNLDSKLVLIRDGASVPIWTSEGKPKLGRAAASNVAPGDYRIQVNVPQPEGSGMTKLTFSSENIQAYWRKAGYQAWEVEGNYIYVDDNTPFAFAINEQWIQDTDYVLEAELTTREVANYPYGYEDWIGLIFNYKDDRNYYAVGLVTETNYDFNHRCGVWKVVDGVGIPSESVAPKWKFSNPNLDVKFDKWRKLRVEVNGNRFKVYVDGVLQVDANDPYAWGGGASGLATYSNPYSSWRFVSYTGKPRFDCHIDNVIVDASHRLVPVPSPAYSIKFSIDGAAIIEDFSEKAKRSYTFPILKGRHRARWEFHKRTEYSEYADDASFIDNLSVTNVLVSGARVEEEFIGCGGHMGAKLLIENLLEYYRRHHEACKGRRDMWIIE